MGFTDSRDRSSKLQFNELDILIAHQKGIISYQNTQG